MRPWYKAPHIRKVEVLSDEEASFALRRFPHREVLRATESLLGDGLDVMAPGDEQARKAIRQVFVQLDVHPM